MIASEVRGDVALITIERERQRNALDTEHCVALTAAVDKAVGDRARCLVITGAGSAFCAGADLQQVYGEEFREALYALLYRLTEVSMPVLAAVNGPAIGAGAQLALATDLRVASASAVFAVPTAKLGLAVDAWTVRRLALLAGGGTARSMLLAAASISAEQAYRRGLVDRLGDLDDALAWASEIAALAPLSQAYAKLVLDHAFEPAVHDVEVDEAFEAVWHSADVAEARAARVEHRTPRFTGR